MRTRALCVAGLIALAATAAPVQAGSGPRWAPASSASIRPGVSVVADTGAQCTSNFVFTETRRLSSGAVRTDVLLGVAAHCFSLGDSTQTDGCTTPSRPHGAKARVDGARYPATLAYSSWRVAQKVVGERNRDVCAANDFALLLLDPRDHGRVNPSVQYFGGPHGVRSTAVGPGERVYSYGNSSLRLGVEQTSPKRGASLGTFDAGWTTQVYTATPGIPGDSGSGVLDSAGRAAGVLVTVAAAPFPASNGVTDLRRALAYANAKTGRSYRLASGTARFGDPVTP